MMTPEWMTFHVGYYEIIFFVLLFAQEHFKDFVSTICCLLMSYLSESVPLYFMVNYDCTYYEAVMFYEAIVYCFSIMILGSRIGVMLCWVSSISFFVNAVGCFMPLHSFYVYYKETYVFWNVLMFEILVWTCLINSKWKPHIVKFDKSIKQKIDKFFSRWGVGGKIK